MLFLLWSAAALPLAHQHMFIVFTLRRAQSVIYLSCTVSMLFLHWSQVLVLLRLASDADQVAVSWSSHVAVTPVFPTLFSELSDVISAPNESAPISDSHGNCCIRGRRGWHLERWQADNQGGPQQ